MGRGLPKAKQSKVKDLLTAGFPKAYCEKYKKQLTDEHQKELDSNARKRKQIAEVKQTRMDVEKLDDRVLAQAVIQDKADKCLAQGDAMTTDIPKYALERQFIGIEKFLKSANSKLKDIQERIRRVEVMHARFLADGTLPEEEELADGVLLLNPEDEFANWFSNLDDHLYEKEGAVEMFKCIKDKLQCLMDAKGEYVVMEVTTLNNDEEYAKVIVHALMEADTEVVLVFYALASFLCVQQDRTIHFVADHEMQYTRWTTEEDDKKVAMYGAKCGEELMMLQTGKVVPGGVAVHIECTQEEVEFPTLQDAEDFTRVSKDIIKEAVKKAEQGGHQYWQPPDCVFSFGPLGSFMDPDAAKAAWDAKYPSKRRKQTDTDLVVLGPRDDFNGKKKKEQLMEDAISKNSPVLYTDAEGKTMLGKITSGYVKKGTVYYNVKVPGQKVIKEVPRAQIVPTIEAHPASASVVHRGKRAKVIRCKTVPQRVNFDPARILYDICIEKTRYRNVAHKDLLLLNPNATVEMSEREKQMQRNEHNLADFDDDEDMQEPEEAGNNQAVDLFTQFKGLGRDEQDAVLQGAMPCAPNDTEYMCGKLLQHKCLDELLTEIGESDELEVSEDRQWYPPLTKRAREIWLAKFVVAKRATKIAPLSSDEDSDSDDETIGQKLAKC